MSGLRNLLAATLLVSASATAGTAQAEPVTLRVLNSTPVDLYAAVNERFMKDNPGVAIKSGPAPADYDVLTQELLRSALVGDLPDVVFQGYSRVSITVERKLAVRLDGMVASEADWAKKGVAPTFADMCGLNGTPYGLPFATSAPIVYFNLELAKKAGYDETELPTDWNGLIKLAKDIKAADASKMGLFFDYATTGNWTFQALLASFGGQFVTPEGKIAFNSAAGEKALTLISELGAAGQVDMTRNQAWQSFSSGGLGILISTSSLLSQFEAQAKGLFTIKTGAFPMSVAGTKLPAGGNCAMILTKDPAKQKAAWDYIKFAAGPVGQTMIAIKSGYIPMNTLSVQDPEMLGNYYDQHPNYKTALQLLPILTRFESFPGENSLKVTTIITDQLREVLTGKAQPHEALAKMTGNVQALLPN